MRGGGGLLTRDTTPYIGLGFRVWGFAKLRGTVFGIPIIRIIVDWGLYWGPPILGNYNFEPWDAFSGLLLRNIKEHKLNWLLFRNLV